MKTLKSWIIIAGSGRNTGKTTLACNIISANRISGIVGIKISPHRHLLSGMEEVIAGGDDYTIVREKSFTTKDSSRMLTAGAAEVYYVQCPDESLSGAFTHLEKLIAGRPVVCESGGIRNIIKPAFFILVVSDDPSDKPGLAEKIRLADMVTDLNEINKVGTRPLFYLEKTEWKKSM